MRKGYTSVSLLGTKHTVELVRVHVTAVPAMPVATKALIPEVLVAVLRVINRMNRPAPLAFVAMLLGWKTIVWIVVIRDDFPACFIQLVGCKVTMMPFYDSSDCHDE